MSQIIIRLAKESELQRVQDLNYELFLNDDKHLHDLNTDWPYNEAGTRYFSECIRGIDNKVCFVAVQGNDVIGYLAGSLQKSHSAYKGKRAEIDNICVAAAHRDEGAGSQLVAAFYKWCRAQAIDYVMVNAYTANHEALAFYQKNGLEPYSTTLWHQLK